MKKVRLGDYIEEFSQRNRKNAPYSVYSVTNSQGFCRDYFNKDVASQNRTTYKLVPRGYFAYNPSRINVGSVDFQRCEDCVIVSPLYVVFSTSPSIDNHYLYYFLKSDIAHAFIRNTARGSVRDNLRFSDLSDFLIPLPSIKEQITIATRIQKAEKLIALFREELIRFDELVKARFVEMLRQRSPRMVPISQIGTVFTGSTPAGDIRHHEGQEIPFAKPSDLCMDYPVNITWTQHCLPIEAKPYVRMYPAGAILVACIASIGKIGIAATSGTCNQQINAIIPNDNIDSYYLAYALHSIQSTIIQAANTAVVPILNKGSFEKICIPIVKEEIQRSFAAFVEQVDKSKVVVQKSLEKAQQLYDSLMQQYFD